MGREARRVPADWVHPLNGAGSLAPMHAGDFAEVNEEWIRHSAKWEQGLEYSYATDDWVPIKSSYSDMSYDEYAGEQPREEDYMPEWTSEEATHYMMYENASEGTPISPVFATPEELARWLTDNKASAFAGDTASYESWLRVCNGRLAASMLMTVSESGEATMQSGVEALSEKVMEEDEAAKEARDRLLKVTEGMEKK